MHLQALSGIYLSQIILLKAITKLVAPPPLSADEWRNESSGKKNANPI
jgi:hypothetical protein